MEQIKIAVCDDKRIAVDTAAAAESILREAGLRVEIARFTKPPELLRHCEREMVDLVLLDIEMPGLDGIELGRVLKAQEPALEIIYISNREDKVFAALHIHPFGFVRIYKGYLVNHAYIASIRTGEVILENGTSLPIRRGGTQEVRSAYLSLQRENGTMLF